MTGLVGWWPLHENSGRANDLSGNSNHGILNGGVTQGVAGKGGLTAYSFSGETGFVKKSAVDQLPTGSEERTLSAWIKVSKDSKQGITGYGCASNNQAFAFLIDGNGEFSGQLWGNSYDMPTGIVPSNNPGWHHHALKYEAGELIYFFDGQEVKRESRSPNTCSGGDFYVGAELVDDRNLYTGKVQDVRVYNRALSPQEIKTLYKLGNGDYASPPNNRTDSSSAVSRWKFDGDVKDSWGSNDGTDNTSAGFSSDAIRGQAKKFDGSDDYIETGYTPSLESTFSCWVKPAQESSLVELMNARINDDGMYLRQNGSSNFYVEIGNNSSFDRTFSETAPRSGEWYHVVGFYDTNTSEVGIAVNGKVENTNTIGRVQNGGLVLGTRSDSADKNFYYGKMDDVRIYDRALEPHEIFQLYQWGTRGRDMRKLTVNKR